MSVRTKHLYEFGPFLVDRAERLLLRDGEVVPLTPRVFDVLALLLESRGHLLERDELLSAVWADSFVEEANLTVSISALRKALGDNNNGHKYIETVPKRGYRFVADVTVVEEEQKDLISPEQLRPHVVVGPEQASAYQDESTVEVETQPTDQLKRPAKRRSTSHPAIACTIAILIVIATGFWWKAKQDRAAAEIKSIAVLPFKVLGTGEHDEFLGLGMSDALITRLGSLNRITVRPESAVFKYIGVDPDPVALGRELNVDAVLEGCIQRVNGHIRITPRLVRVRAGELVWAETFDGETSEIFALQDAIAERTAIALALDLTENQRRLITKQYTRSLLASQAYDMGRYFWNKRTEDGLRKAIGYFEQAISKDPEYALAYSGLADAYLLLGGFCLVPPKEVFPKARAAAVTAVQLDETLAEAQTSLAYALMNSDWDWPGAERAFKRALDLNYNYATAHHWYSEYLAAMGRIDEALVEARFARDIDPRSLIINTNIGYDLYLARRYDEAIEVLRSTLEMDQNFGFAHIILGQAYGAKGQWLEAFAEWGASADLVTVYRKSGLRAYLRRFVEDNVEQSKHRYTSGCQIASLFAMLGDKEQAFKYLQKACEEGDANLLWLKVGPYDSLRSDPRYAEMLRRIRLSD